MNKEELFEGFVAMMARFAQLRAVTALRDGFIMTTPFTICGSVFLLLANLPIPGYGDLMAAALGDQWNVPLYAVAGGTFSILGFIAVSAITYQYCNDEGCDGAMASLLALATFVMVCPEGFTLDNGQVVGGVIPKMWAGSNGVITAILVSFYVSWIFCYCARNNVGIQMPSSVPGGVARAFSALVPGMLIFTSGSLVYGLCYFMGGTTLPELLFTVVQVPLQSLTDTLTGGVIIAGLQSVLFWAGIHGPNIIGGVAGPMLIANSLDNQAILDAGLQLIGNPDAKIVTCQINDVFIKSGGCGMTMGFVIASVLVSKSKQLRAINRMTVVPSLFNINEPIIFGLPIVFNPYLLVPFVLVPIFAMMITYVSIAIGFMSPFSAVQVPWTTPPVIAGFLINGWQGGVVQIINLLMAVLVYLPFVKAQDNVMCEEEARAEEEFF